MVRERTACDRRVALTPCVVRRLAGAGHVVWVETGAGSGAMFHDNDYAGAGAQLVYSAADAIQRADVLAKIAVPRPDELRACRPGMAVMAFFHLAVADRAVYQALVQGGITAIGCEIIQTEEGTLPVLAPVSEVAGQMTVSLAAHLMWSSSGGRGILLGGSPGIPPAHVVILGAGAVGGAAARTAAAAGARVTVLDVDPLKLRRLMEHVPHVATCLADSDSIASAVAAADVLIGAVLVPGGRTPHIVTRAMVERMKPGAAIIDVSIDQGGCCETSRPTTIADPTFVSHGVTHFCVPNFTANLGRTASVAIAQAMLPYLLAIGEHGIDGAMEHHPDLRRGLYTHRGACASAALAEAWKA
ncbi:MAG: alanine dehydrogenase [Bryobacteraceae bacterium]